jgi:RES domain
MSQSIWTLCAARFKARRLSRYAWRAVEDQSVNSTRRLVDSDEEQAVLEALIDQVKPPLPTEFEVAGLHYLLWTPFRYPPLRHGSRFGTRSERGIFYGSETKPTVLAEKAYYRCLFLAGTEAPFSGGVTQSITLFEFSFVARRGADLTLPPFDEFEAAICSPTSYTESQPLGAELRSAGVQAFRFRSARDPGRGVNVGLIEPVFQAKQPLSAERWICTATRERIEMKPGLIATGAPLSFPWSRFEQAGVLPTPGI